MSKPESATHAAMDIRTDILGIVHLVGCQAQSGGWNNAKQGKELDLEEVERLENTTADELTKLFTEAMETAISTSRVRVDNGAMTANIVWQLDEELLRQRLAEMVGNK